MKACIIIYAFGQIQVLAEFESSIFDEVSFKELIFPGWEMILQSIWFPCTMYKSLKLIANNA